MRRCKAAGAERGFCVDWNERVAGLFDRFKESPFERLGLGKFSQTHLGSDFPS